MLVDTLRIRGRCVSFFSGDTRCGLWGGLFPAVTQARRAIVTDDEGRAHAIGEMYLNAIKDADGDDYTLASGGSIRDGFAACLVGVDWCAVCTLWRGVHIPPACRSLRVASLLRGGISCSSDRPNPLATRLAACLGFASPTRIPRKDEKCMTSQARMVRHARPATRGVFWPVWTVTSGMVCKLIYGARQSAPCETMYFYRMTAGTFRAQKKLVILP